MDSDLVRRIERLEAVNAIQNIIARYTALHAASRQEETCELFCKKTPGTYWMVGNAVYNGHQGVRDHFVHHMGDNEKDLTGRLYLHEMVTPLIEVAGDCQTAKCLINTMGCETGPGETEGNVSLWAFSRYRWNFAKEDGEWKIWNMRLYITFLTPFAGGGWTETPYYPIHEVAVKRGLAKPGTNYVTYFAPGEEMKPFSITSPDCDIHNLIPEPPKPYWTWDEPIGPPGGPAII
ncbi:MAG: nuclear transport factor 2 family protein [Oscillospiraceae bacterium]